MTDKGHAAALNRSQQPSPDQVLGDVYLVAVILERPGAFERELAGLARDLLVELFAAQECLRLDCPPGNRRDPAHHDIGVAHDSRIAIDDNGDGGDRMIPGESFAHLMVKTFADGFRDGNNNLGHDLNGRENILTPVIRRWQDKKFLQRNRLLPCGAEDFDLRAKRYQCRRRIGGMNNIARPRAENGVEAAVAGERVTNLPALAQAEKVC